MTIDPDRYLSLIADGERPGMRDAMKTMSGCALFIRGLWRALGVQDVWLGPPYKIGMAIADVVRTGSKHAAFRPLDQLPEPGDVVLIGGGADGGGSEHVFLVVNAEHKSVGIDIESMDGGQLDGAGKQLIIGKARHWERKRAATWDHCGTRIRKVRRVIDVSKIPAVCTSADDTLKP